MTSPPASQGHLWKLCYFQNHLFSNATGSLMTTTHLSLAQALLGPPKSCAKCQSQHPTQVCNRCLRFSVPRIEILGSVHGHSIHLGVQAKNVVFVIFLPIYLYQKISSIKQYLEALLFRTSTTSTLFHASTVCHLK